MRTSLFADLASAKVRHTGGHWSVPALAWSLPELDRLGFTPAPPVFRTPFRSAAPAPGAIKPRRYWTHAAPQMGAPDERA